MVIELVLECSRVKVSRLLDIGCGEGGFTNVLKEITGASEAYGVDISEEYCKESLTKGICALRMDVNYGALPFPDNFFDLIFCGDILQHLFNPDNILTEIHRVLTEDGILLLTISNLASYANRVALLLGYQPYYADISTKISCGKLLRPVKVDVPYHGHYRGYTLRALKQLLSFYNFKVVKIRGGVDPNIPACMHALDRLLSKIPSISSHLSICVRKQQNTPIGEPDFLDNKINQRGADVLSAFLPTIEICRYV